MKYYKYWRCGKVLDYSSTWAHNDPVKVYTDADWAGEHGRINPKHSRAAARLTWLTPNTSGLLPG